MHRLVAAVDKEMAPDGVIKGAGGGDGGLFNGVTARYLALVVTTLPDKTPEDAAASDTARNIVLKSAQSAWDYRQNVDGLPLFGPFWDRNAELPDGGRAGRPVRRGRRQLVLDSRARPVGAAVGLDADGGGARHFCERRERIRHEEDTLQ